MRRRKKPELLKVIVVLVAVFYLVLIASVAVNSSRNRFEKYDTVPVFMMVQLDYATI